MVSPSLAFLSATPTQPTTTGLAMQCSFKCCGMDDVSRRTYKASGTWIILQCRAWRGRRSDAGVASISPGLDFMSTAMHPR